MSFNAEVSWLFIVTFVVIAFGLCYFVVLGMNKSWTGLHLLSPELVPGHHDGVPHGEDPAGDAILVLGHEGEE